MVTDLLGDRGDFLLSTVHVRGGGGLPGDAVVLASSLVDALAVLVAGNVARGGECGGGAQVVVMMVDLVEDGVAAVVVVWRLRGSRYRRR